MDAREDNQLQTAVRGSLAASQKKSEEESDSRASEPTRAAPSLPETSTDEDWWQHLGPQSDPHSSIVFRFPDGSKDQKSLPSSSTLMVSHLLSLFDHVIADMRLIGFNYSFFKDFKKSVTKCLDEEELVCFSFCCHQGRLSAT